MNLVNKPASCIIIFVINVIISNYHYCVYITDTLVSYATIMNSYTNYNVYAIIINIYYSNNVNVMI